MAKVLLVDDSAAILRTLELALQHAGHDVEKANGPQEALERAQASTPDVMIVDVMMPGGTEGFELVWQIRDHDDDALRQVPIIMATGIQDQTDLSFYPRLPEGLFEPERKLDVQGWLDKPVRPQVLLDAITTVLGVG